MDCHKSGKDHLDLPGELGRMNKDYEDDIAPTKYVPPEKPKNTVNGKTKFYFGMLAAQVR